MSLVWKLLAPVTVAFILGSLCGAWSTGLTYERKLEEQKHRYENWDQKLPPSKVFETCAPDTVKCDGFRSTDLGTKPGSPGKLLIHCGCDEAARGLE